ncbi:MAG: hypothetical protein GXP26_07680 [Planctomycetes bacterium]|nr:hypothetical protein [Planctomycetota bacterium]
MVSQPPQHRIWRYAAIAVCAVVIGGCAGLPRIDPTGERVFIWPRQQAQPVAPSVGNAQVSPVFTDPVFPAPTLPPTIGALPVGAPPVPQDTLSITPQRVLAPVGSEVILKAGLCTREKFLLTKTRIDWLIARESAGEFVSLGGRGWLQNPLMPWNKPKKIDNQYATGYSAKVPLTITRGTQDPRDDVQVEPGEAWVSITSPVEGTSHITAMTPEIETWSQRRATATIYWVDVQWSFPPASISADGSQVLTTTVRRQTDGTPLEGWIVRYEVAGGGGSLRGTGSDQVVEVRTDGNGKASIDVTPTGEGGNTTQIKTQVVRPERYRDSDAPQLIVANGETTINWSGSGTPYLPPPDDLGSPPPMNTPLTTPFTTPPPQPAPPAVNLKPVLEVEIFGDAEAQVGGIANFEVVIKNVGNTVATGIEMRDRFDPGLSHPGDSLGSQEIRKTFSQTIAPGASIQENLKFNVGRAGKLCHVVTVTSQGGTPIQKQACVNVVQPLPPSRDVLPAGPPSANVVPPGTAPGGGTLAVEIIPLSASELRVSQLARYQIVIANRASTPDEQVRLVVTFPPELRPDVSAVSNSAKVGAQMVGNQLQFQPVAQLQPGEKIDFVIPVSVNQQGTRNITAEVTSRSVTTPIRDVEQVTIYGR